MCFNKTEYRLNHPSAGIYKTAGEPSSQGPIFAR